MSTTQLNRTQKKFCKIPSNRNVRLLAPAGSGKTFLSNKLVLNIDALSDHEVEERMREFLVDQL